jgi:hypothetical protein
LTSDTSASTTFAVGPAGAASLIYASAATLAATSETATAGPTIFGDFMGSPLLPSRGTVARRNSFMRCRGGRVFGRPSSPQDRTQPAKLEIPFGHAFDKRGVSLPKALCACAPWVYAGTRIAQPPLLSKRTGSMLVTHGGEDFRQRITQFRCPHTLVSGIDV